MFKVRTVPCSFNKTVYEKDRDSFNCQSSINVYHCIQNERNRSGEICIQPVWVQPSKSYIYIQEVYKITLHNFKCMPVGFNLVFNLNMLQYSVYT